MVGCKYLDYMPDPLVLQRLHDVDFVAVVGPTGVGKSTIISALAARDATIHPIMATTSRPPRSGEQDTIDFHFKTDQEMQKQIAKGQYVQVAPSVLEYTYATAPADYSTNGVAIMPVVAIAIPTFKALPFKRFRQLFILPPSWDIWQKRIAQRQFAADQLAKRLVEAEQSLEYALTEPDILFVINDDLAQSVAATKRVLQENHATTDDETAKKLARDLLERLKLQQLPL